MRSVSLKTGTDEQLKAQQNKTETGIPYGLSRIRSE
jgi:hypothetical protein